MRTRGSAGVLWRCDTVARLGTVGCRNTTRCGSETARGVGVRTVPIVKTFPDEQVDVSADHTVGPECECTMMRTGRRDAVEAMGIAAD